MVPRVKTARKYAGDRLRVLAEYGLVRMLAKGLYRITDEGNAYFDEELAHQAAWARSGDPREMSHAARPRGRRRPSVGVTCPRSRGSRPA